jgi:hypothetical protein
MIRYSLFDDDYLKNISSKTNTNNIDLTSTDIYKTVNFCFYHLSNPISYSNVDSLNNLVNALKVFLINGSINKNVRHT